MSIWASRLLAASIVMLAALALPWQPAVAESYIERVENKALTGAAYARLRNLTYLQCEERCLRDGQCVAFEYHRGGGQVPRSYNCALFNATDRALDSQFSDIGYKRQRTATDGTKATRKAARPQFDGLAKGGTGEGGGGSGQGSIGFGGPVRSIAPPQPPPPPREAPAAAPGSSEPTGGAGPSAPAEPATRSATRSVRPPAAVTPPPVAAAPTVAAPPGVERRSASPAPDQRFHLVPVFYGTDRNQVKQEGRIGYGNDRAKRLELGRALISVPLDHKVPNIERPRAWTIPYIGTIQLEKEDPNRHFTMREIKVHTKAELINLVKQRLGASQTFRNQSIVFIHGYNNSFDGALFRTAQISYDLQFDGAAFAYSWPSGGGLSSYIYDRDSAQGAERYLYEFLEMVQNETGSTSINIIAHSMGNQMLMQVLRSLKLRAPAAMARINQIILASPDIDRDAFESLAAEVTGVAKGITLYAAANDRALEASRIVAGNKPRAGDVPEGGPVIVAGIDSIDITQISSGYLTLNHSGYAEHTDLLTDIATIIRTGTRPWERRLKAYKPVTVPAGTYWRYEN